MADDGAEPGRAAGAEPGRAAGADRPRGRIRRILVALDTSADSLAGLEAAAELAAELEAELTGLFVEDELLLRVGRLPVAREITFLTGEPRRVDEAAIERQLRAQAARARHVLEATARKVGASWRFRTARGRVARVLLEAGEEADLLALGITGRSPLGGPGSTVRALLEAARHDLLILRHGLPLGRVVLAVHDGSRAGRRAVRRGADLALRRGGRLVVLLTPGDAEEAARLGEQARELARELGVGAHTRHVPGGDVSALCEAVSRSGGGLLVAPAPGYRGERAGALGELLRSAGCPLVLVS